MTTDDVARALASVLVNALRNLSPIGNRPAQSFNCGAQSVTGDVQSKPIPQKTLNKWLGFEISRSGFG